MSRYTDLNRRFRAVLGALMPEADNRENWVKDETIDGEWTLHMDIEKKR